MSFLTNRRLSTHKAKARAARSTFTTLSGSFALSDEERAILRGVKEGQSLEELRSRRSSVKGTKDRGPSRT